MDLSVHKIMYVCMYVCIYVCMYVCECVYVCVCVCVCVCMTTQVLTTNWSVSEIALLLYIANNYSNNELQQTITTITFTVLHSHS
jgi:hypothetical protein